MTTGNAESPLGSEGFGSVLFFSLVLLLWFLLPASSTRTGANFHRKFLDRVERLSDPHRVCPGSFSEVGVQADLLIVNI
jgi:hypothetical protein